MIRDGLKNILQFMCHNLLLWKILKLLPDQIVKANDSGKVFENFWCDESA